MANISTDCPICLEDLSSKEFGNAFPCGHVFHLDCFQNLGSNPNCPTCRKPTREFCRIYLNLQQQQQQQQQQPQSMLLSRPTMAKDLLLSIAVLVATYVAIRATIMPLFSICGYCALLGMYITQCVTGWKRLLLSIALSVPAYIAFRAINIANTALR